MTEENTSTLADTDPNTRPVGAQPAEVAGDVVEKVGEAIDNLDPKHKKYLIVGLFAVAAVLAIVAIVNFIRGGDNETTGSAGAAAALVAAEATRRRSASRKAVEEVKTGILQTGADIRETHGDAVVGMAGVEEKVEKASDEDLKDAGENLFG